MKTRNIFFTGREFASFPKILFSPTITELKNLLDIQTTAAMITTSKFVTSLSDFGSESSMIIIWLENGLEEISAETVSGEACKTLRSTTQIIMLIGTTESKNPNAQAEAEEIKSFEKNKLELK